MKANAWHHRADAISSIVALIGVGKTSLLINGYSVCFKLLNMRYICCMIYKLPGVICLNGFV